MTWHTKLPWVGSDVVKGNNVEVGTPCVSSVSKKMYVKLKN